MDLHLYPMDIQKCDFRIVLLKSKSWVASLKWKAKKPIEFYGKPSALAFVIHLPSVGFHLSKRTNKVILGVHFVFERRVKGAILTVYLPSALVTVCSWLSFWIGVAAAPARVTLGVTALLTLMTQMARVKGQLPPIDYIMTMDIWMFTNIAFVVASLMEFGVAFNLEGRFTYESVHDARNKEKPTPKPRISAIKAWPKQKSKCHFVETVKMRDKREWTTPVPLYDSRWSDPRSTTGKSPRGRICSLRSFMQVFGKGEAVNPADYASRIIFPVAWISFVTFYWVNYLYIDQRWDWNV